MDFIDIMTGQYRSKLEKYSSTTVYEGLRTDSEFFMIMMCKVFISFSDRMDTIREYLKSDSTNKDDLLTNNKLKEQAAKNAALIAKVKMLDF